MPLEIDPKIMETMQAKSLWEITQSDTFREYLKNLFSNLPPSVFDFDTPGDTAGFTGGYIRDDNDIAYGSALSVHHFQFAQYDMPFPLPMGTKPPYGTLAAMYDQMRIHLEHFSFPETSAYWYHDIFSPDLTGNPKWQNLNGIEAWLFDGSSIGTESFINVELYLVYSINGTTQEVLIETVDLKRYDWVQVSKTISLGQNSILKNLKFRVKGDWAQSSLPVPQQTMFGGSVLFDHIAAL